MKKNINLEYKLDGQNEKSTSVKPFENLLANRENLIQKWKNTVFLDTSTTDNKISINRVNYKTYITYNGRNHIGQLLNVSNNIVTSVVNPFDFNPITKIQFNVNFLVGENIPFILNDSIILNLEGNYLCNITNVEVFLNNRFVEERFDYTITCVGHPII